jgi:hypothetical protein
VTVLRVCSLLTLDKHFVQHASPDVSPPTTEQQYATHVQQAQHNRQTVCQAVYHAQLELIKPTLDKQHANHATLEHTKTKLVKQHAYHVLLGHLNSCPHPTHALHALLVQLPCQPDSLCALHALSVHTSIRQVRLCAWIAPPVLLNPNPVKPHASHAVLVQPTEYQNKAHAQLALLDRPPHHQGRSLVPPVPPVHINLPTDSHHVCCVTLVQLSQPPDSDNAQPVHLGHSRMSQVKQYAQPALPAQLNHWPDSPLVRLALPVQPPPAQDNHHVLSVCLVALRQWQGLTHAQPVLRVNTRINPADSHVLIAQQVSSIGSPDNHHVDLVHLVNTVMQQVPLIVLNVMLVHLKLRMDNQHVFYVPLVHMLIVLVNQHVSPVPLEHPNP